MADIGCENGIFRPLFGVLAWCFCSWKEGVFVVAVEYLTRAASLYSSFFFLFFLLLLLSSKLLSPSIYEHPLF